MYIHIVGKVFYPQSFIIIVNFPHLDSNIPTKPAHRYGVYISQLHVVRIGRICDRYEDFNCVLTQRLLEQGYRYDNLCSTFKRFYNTYAEIVGKLHINSIKKMEWGCPLMLYMG